MKKYKNLILNGGSINGIAHLGAIKELNDRKLLKDLETVTGSSSGSLNGIFAILNKNLDETISDFVSCNFSRLKNIKFNHLSRWGLDDGKKFEEWIEYLLYKNTNIKNITLEELYLYKPITYTVTVTNLKTLQTEYFNHLTTPELRVSQAIKISMCIPPYFIPNIYNNNLYIDGGLSRNFPVIYEKDVIGLKLNYVNDEKIFTFYKYINRILDCIKNNENEIVNGVVIPINIKPISTYKFVPTLDVKRKLVFFGKQSVIDYLR